MSEKALRIKSKQGNLRRCGFDFTESFCDFPISKFKCHQIESLKSDLLLEVLEIENKEIKQKEFEVLEQFEQFSEYKQEGYI